MTSQSSPYNHAKDASEAVDPDTGQSNTDHISFHQKSTVSAPSLKRSTSNETQSSTPRRVKPSRAVFHDLPTAHSSITSGTARSRTRRLSNNLSETYEEEDSIPLQEFSLPKRRHNPTQPLFDELPLPPPPTATSQYRFNSHSDSSVFAADDNLTSRQQGKAKLAPHNDPMAQRSSLFTNLKSAFASSSAPATINTPSNWPGSNRNKGKQHAHYRENSSSIYHSGLGAAPSGSLPPSSADIPSLDSSRKHGFDSYDAIPFPDFHSTPLPHQGISALPDQYTQDARLTRVLSNAVSSLPEGSTVGNIYKHYAQSDSLEDFDSGSNNTRCEYDLGNRYDIKERAPQSYDVDRKVYFELLPNNQDQRTALYARKQQRAERALSNSRSQPPGLSLPSLPKLLERTLQSNSQGIANSSSYGDTENLLDLPEPCRRTGHMPTSSGLKDGNKSNSSQDLAEVGKYSRLATSHLNPDNLFRINCVPKVLVNDKDHNHKDHYHYIQGSNREPLEREVSKALRRASNFSTYSNDSIATSVLEQYVQFQKNTSSPHWIGIFGRNSKYSPSSDPDLLDEETRTAAAQAQAQAQAFYQKGAIPANNWPAAHETEVRIPIKRNRQFPNSPPIPPGIPEGLIDIGQRDVADDGNDWETVGESGFGTDYKSSTPGMLGADFARRAGSSIANTSDDGSVSTHIPEISDYGSTERIAQHPGNIKYCGDYRQRDLKDTNIPVFLPVFREHKVNGYLADSIRTRPPPNPCEYNPTPLNRKHTNPFNSLPPEVMGVTGKSFTRDLRNTRPSQFPTPTSITTYISSEENTTPEHAVPVSKGPIRGPKSPPGPRDWMDDFGDPGPEINYSKHNCLKPISSVTAEDRPSSWQHMMMNAAGGSVADCNKNGTRLLDSPFGHGGGRGVMREHNLSKFSMAGANTTREVMQNDGFVEVNTYGSKNLLINPRERSTLVKGPPGAFYYGISRPKTKRSQSYTTDRPPRARDTYRQSSAKEYLTNTLRPLSLVTNRQRDQRPVTPNDKIGPDPSNNTTPNDFVYRSPLAPVKLSTWKQLYTPEQLSNIREAAQADGIYDNRASQPATPHDGLDEEQEISLKEGSSRKHLYEFPRLYKWNREPSAYTVAHRRKKLSILILFMCNLFPPFLLCFGLGGMDGLINLWTKGESTAFDTDQKRMAFWLLFGWCIATFTAIIVFLILWFTHHRS